MRDSASRSVSHSTRALRLVAAHRVATTSGVRFAAEFGGTLILVFYSGLIAATTSSSSLGTASAVRAGVLNAFVVLLFAGGLMTLSGAHLNPAVTLAHAVVKTLRWRDATTYIGVQSLGALLGGLVVALMLGDTSHTIRDGVPGRPHVGTTAAFGAEAAGTFALACAYLGSRSAGDRPPWAIAITFGLATAAVMPLTGAGLNPARATALAFVSGDVRDPGLFFCVYILGPLCAPVVAGALYAAVRRVHGGATASFLPRRRWP
jgi:glycerol uptake facilitator-like aquaporin